MSGQPELDKICRALNEGLFDATLRIDPTKERKEASIHQHAKGATQAQLLTRERSRRMLLVLDKIQQDELTKEKNQ